MLYVLICCRIHQSENNFPLLRMLANLLLPLLLVACGSQAQDYWFCTFFPELCNVKSPNNPNPPSPDSDKEKMAVDTAGSCNCACALTAEVTMAHLTKYNACVGRGDRQRLYSS